MDSRLEKSMWAQKRRLSDFMWSNKNCENSNHQWTQGLVCEQCTLQMIAGLREALEVVRNYGYQSKWTSAEALVVLIDEIVDHAKTALGEVIE